MRKKILMVLESEFPPDDRVFKEATSLTEQGFSVTIACYTFGNKPAKETWKNIHIIRKRIPQLIYKSSVAALKFPVYFSWWKRYLNPILKNGSFDILHIHDLPLAKVGSYFKQKYGVKLVVDLHENWPAFLSGATHTKTWLGKLLFSESQWRNYEKTILTQADQIITVVDEMKNRIVRLGLSETKISVLENTITPEEYQVIKDKKTSDDFILFFAGGINIERGLQHVIRALPKVKDKIPGLCLKIVGDGSYLPVLRSITRELALESIVRFYGWKPLKEVMVLTAQADIALIPHLKWEQTDCSSPNKLFQYMHAGVPLLVSNCNSVARIVRETQTGEVYTFDDPDDFAEKLIYLYAHPELRTQMSLNGPDRIIEKYNWKTGSQSFIKVYESLSK